MLLVTVILASSLCELGVVSGREIPTNLVKGNTDFAMEVFKELSATKDDRNIFVSPVSISFALGLTCLGARGNTLKEIQNALRINNKSKRDQIHKFFMKINKHLSLNNHAVYMANSLFVDEKFQVRKKFLKKARRFYDATVDRLNFGRNSSSSVKRINNWVSKVTRMRIPQLIAQLDVNSDMRLMLTNAIYFKAEWDQKFERNLTKPAAFFVSETRSINVPMMHQLRMKLHYIEKEWGQVVELPFNKKKFSMILIKPNYKNISLSSFERLLTSHFINSLSLREEFVTVSLPRFKITSDDDIGEVFKRMGISDLFDKTAADLSGIQKTEKLYVSKVLHKAVVEVNEEGSEAAAATGVLITTRSEKFSHYFVADRPFFFLIRDNKSRIVLFLGWVVEPGTA